MKNYLLLIFLFSATLQTTAQEGCEDANSYLVIAYSHVKDAYDSNNISHLKYYAKRSVESFKLAKGFLNTCDCKTALELTDKGIDLLAKVKHANTFEDGRFFVKRGRDVAKESMIESDKCSYANPDVIDVAQTEEKGIAKNDMATKEKLITSYITVISSNIKSYNEALNACDCNHSAIKNTNVTEDLQHMSIEDIQKKMTSSLKDLATNYLSELDACK